MFSVSKVEFHSTESVLFIRNQSIEFLYKSFEINADALNAAIIRESLKTHIDSITNNLEDNEFLSKNILDKINDNVKKYAHIYDHSNPNKDADTLNNEICLYAEKTASIINALKDSNTLFLLDTILDFNLIHAENIIQTLKNQDERWVTQDNLSIIFRSPLDKYSEINIDLIQNHTFCGQTLSQATFNFYLDCESLSYEIKCSSKLFRQEFQNFQKILSDIQPEDMKVFLEVMSEDFLKVINGFSGFQDYFLETLKQFSEPLEQNVMNALLITNIKQSMSMENKIKMLNISIMKIRQNIFEFFEQFNIFLRQNQFIFFNDDFEKSVQAIKRCLDFFKPLCNKVLEAYQIFRKYHAYCQRWFNAFARQNLLHSRYIALPQNAQHIEIPQKDLSGERLRCIDDFLSAFKEAGLSDKLTPDSLKTIGENAWSGFIDTAEALLEEGYLEDEEFKNIVWRFKADIESKNALEKFYAICCALHRQRFVDLTQLQFLLDQMNMNGELSKIICLRLENFGCLNPSVFDAFIAQASFIQTIFLFIEIVLYKSELMKEPEAATQRVINTCTFIQIFREFALKKINSPMPYGVEDQTKLARVFKDNSELLAECILLCEQTEAEQHNIPLTPEVVAQKIKEKLRASEEIDIEEMNMSDTSSLSPMDLNDGHDFA